MRPAIHFCMDSDANWELYRSFLGVLEHASLSGAARALGIAQPTVGRHIAELEKVLGVALFTRSQAGLTPTEAALELRGYAEAMRSNAAALRRAAGSQGAGVRGTVRISASEVIGIEVLPPIVAQLQADHPELKVELVLSNRVQDLLRREADIAVRMTQPKQELLIARRLGQVELGLYAHESYLSRRGTPGKPADLASHALIGFDEETPFLRSAKKRVPGWEREAFAMRTDNDVAQLALIRAGAGIGVCQVPIAARDPRLVRVLAPEIAIPLETWLVMHEDLRNSARCRAAFDALRQGLLRHVS
jgi:DNA-binding transcriptional LysR family regulator